MKLNLKCEQIVTKETYDTGAQLGLIFTRYPYRKTDVIEAYWTSNHKVIHCTFQI